MGYQLNIKKPEKKYLFSAPQQISNMSQIKGNKGAKKHSIATAPNTLYVTIFFSMKHNR
jgi:hypothetical protein